jgi:MATE family multidrug resistance protein
MFVQDSTTSEADVLEGESPKDAPSTQDSAIGLPHNAALPGGYRELLMIAIPLVISSGTQSMMHVIDRVFLTWSSVEAVAAALPAGILFWSFLSLPFGIVSYANAMVAQYDGARQPYRAASCVWQAIYVAILGGLMLALPAIVSTTLFQIVGHGSKVEALEVEYFFWICMGGLPALLMAAMSAFFSGRGRTRVVMVVNFLAMFVNAGLDYAMIFGWGPFPKWGMAGAAIATDLSNVFAVVCFAGLLMTHDARVSYQFWKNWRVDRVLMWDLFKFGGPSGLQMFLDVAGFTAFMMIIGHIGQRELAATNLAFNLNTLAFIPVIGVGIAVSTLVGQRIGEGRPEIAEKSARKGFVLAGGFMLIFGAIYVLLPQVLLLPYEIGLNTQEEIANFQKVREVVILLLRFVAIYSFFDAMAIIFGSAIRAAGDTVFSMIVTFVCAWGLLVLPTWLTWRSFGEHHEAELLFWSWVWCSIYVSALGFIYLGRFNGGRWKSMTVVEPATT